MVQTEPSTYYKVGDITITMMLQWTNNYPTMQYVSNVTTSQSLYFTKPVDYDQSTKLKFTSYSHNFEVTPVVTTYNNFVKVAFMLSETQAAYFSTASEFKVSFGSATDLVRGNTTPSEVIQYSSNQ